MSLLLAFPLLDDDYAPTPVSVVARASAFPPVDDDLSQVAAEDADAPPPSFRLAVVPAFPPVDDDLSQVAEDEYAPPPSFRLAVVPAFPPVDDDLSQVAEDEYAPPPSFRLAVVPAFPPVDDDLSQVAEDEDNNEVFSPPAPPVTTPTLALPPPVNDEFAPVLLDDVVCTPQVILWSVPQSITSVDTEDAVAIPSLDDDDTPPPPQVVLRLVPILLPDTDDDFIDLPPPPPPPDTGGGGGIAWGDREKERDTTDDFLEDVARIREKEREDETGSHATALPTPFSVEVYAASLHIEIHATLLRVQVVERGNAVTFVAPFTGDPDEVHFVYMRPGEERPIADPGFGQRRSNIVRLAAGVYIITIDTTGFQGGVLQGHFFGIGAHQASGFVAVKIPPRPAQLL